MKGSWTAHGSIASQDGGAIGWSRTYTFFSDGRYTMTGYPSIQHEGRWQIWGASETGLELRLDGTLHRIEMTDATMTMDGTVYEIEERVGADFLTDEWEQTLDGKQRIFRFVPDGSWVCRCDAEADVTGRWELLARGHRELRVRLCEAVCNGVARPEFECETTTDVREDTGAIELLGAPLSRRGPQWRPRLF